MASDLTDRPAGIRPGEELDEAKIEAFLKDTFPGLHGQLTIRQYPGGDSNLAEDAGHSHTPGGHPVRDA